MSFRRFEHFSIGFGQSPPEWGDLEEKGARRLVAYRPSRGSPVELPWNENRRHLEAYRPRRLTRNGKKKQSKFAFGMTVE